MRNSRPDLNTSTDEILTRLCKALSDGMDRFEARSGGNRYANLIEKHREAVNDIVLGKHGPTVGRNSEKAKTK